MTTPTPKRLTLDEFDDEQIARPELRSAYERFQALGNHIPRLDAAIARAAR